MRNAAGGQSLILKNILMIMQKTDLMGLNAALKKTFWEKMTGGVQNLMLLTFGVNMSLTLFLTPSTG
jgi:hypothetical protein